MGGGSPFISAADCSPKSPCGAARLKRFCCFAFHGRRWPAWRWSTWRWSGRRWPAVSHRFDVATTTTPASKSDENSRRMIIASATSTTCRGMSRGHPGSSHAAVTGRHVAARHERHVAARHERHVVARHERPVVSTWNSSKQRTVASAASWRATSIMGSHLQRSTTRRNAVDGSPFCLLGKPPDNHVQDATGNMQQTICEM